MLADRIRAELSAIHAVIDLSPMAGAMVSGQIDREAYGLMLWSMVELHTAFEDAADGAATLPDVFRAEGFRRAADIRRDLTALGFTQPEPVNGTVMELMERFAEWASSTPWKLAGALYVFEGSRMGSMVMAKSLARAFGVAPTAGTGLDYHLAGVATRPQQWMAFRSLVNGLHLDAAAEADVVAGAVDTMTAMADVYEHAPTRLATC